MEVWLAETRDAANKAIDILLARFSEKYPAAMKKLEKDRKEPLVFYNFLSEHWRHNNNDK
ncbi:MAG: transposase [Arsenophonus sp. NEOnobi-MAG3]